MPKASMFRVSFEVIKCKLQTSGRHVCGEEELRAEAAIISLKGSSPCSEWDTQVSGGAAACPRKLVWSPQGEELSKVSRSSGQIREKMDFSGEVGIFP